MITGIHDASYSRKRMDANQRAQQTFRTVILPILQVAVAQLQDNPEVQGYAIEVSHYVRGKLLGVSVQTPENLAIVLPSAAARKLLGSTDVREQQTSLQDGEVFLNAQPFSLDLSSSTAPGASRIPYASDICFESHRRQFSVRPAIEECAFYGSQDSTLTNNWPVIRLVTSAFRRAISV